MTERWRACDQFPGYDVSNQGRVRSWRLPGRPGPIRRRATPVPLSLRRSPEGHWMVTLRRDGGRQAVPVHRLVCRAWHGPPPEGKPLALHIDARRDNNHPSNLEWGDRALNKSQFYQFQRRRLLRPMR